MLSTNGCRVRQMRMLGEMERHGWDLFFTADFRTTYYFSGALGSEDAPAAFLLWSDGTSALLTAVEGETAADRVERLQVYSIDRSIDRPFHDAVPRLRELLAVRPFATCAVERTRTPGLWEELLGNAAVADATDAVLRLRKRKEADEVEEIRESLRYCAAAYTAARETIAPGLTEIDVYNAMYAAVTRAAGSAIPFPGDFACGERCIRGGGPPTSRVLLHGDLYILDLFPAPHLYFGDTCRTFAVGAPTDEQLRAWAAVRQAMRVGEAAVRPGIPARDVYAAVKGSFDNSGESEGSFWHHAGHGIGFRGHEAPRIIPGSSDVFEIGDVFTLEPGLYLTALQGGIRLEDNYVLEEDGLHNLFDFPLEL